MKANVYFPSHRTGEDISFTLRGLTKNFRVGFGSFVDKPVMPYVSQAQGARENPCVLLKDTCVPAYGFRNHLNLSNDVNQFTEKVKTWRGGGVIDHECRQGYGVEGDIRMGLYRARFMIAIIPISFPGTSSLMNPFIKQ